MDMSSITNQFPANLNRFLPHKTEGNAGGKNVGNAERMVSGFLGLWMLRNAMKKDGWMAKAALVIPAVAMLKRSFTGVCDVYKAASLSSVSSDQSHNENEATFRKKAGIASENTSEILH